MGSGVLVLFYLLALFPQMIPNNKQGGILGHGMDVQERGEPLETPINSLFEFSPAISKAACIQAMHEHRPMNAPITAAVDYNMLIKEASALLKPYLLAKQVEIRRDAAFNAQLIRGGGAALNPREITTQAAKLHSVINLAREMGWNDLPSNTKHTGYNVRQTNCSQERGHTDHPPKSQRWKELCNHALSLGNPKAVLQRQSVINIQSLTDAFMKRNDKNQEEHTPNTQTLALVPASAPSRNSNPFSSQNQNSKN